VARYGKTKSAAARYGALHRPIRDEVLAAMARVVDSNAFILGEDVKQLEKSIAEYCHVPYAIGCGSGSDALLLAMMAAGVEPGDAVLTTPFHVLRHGRVHRARRRNAGVRGYRPGYLQYGPAGAGGDHPAHAQGEGVMPVHLYGGCADMDPILEIARGRGCVVIEDGAQAIGAEYKGRRAQSMGDIGCLSFYPTKNLGAFGEGGMVLTRDQAWRRN
jgi:dTDP-4-amino-4,6-dideoxygalactose transaminase